MNSIRFIHHQQGFSIFFSFLLCFNRQNIVDLHIYFQELSYQLIQEIPAYDTESLLGKWVHFRQALVVDSL